MWRATHSLALPLACALSAAVSAAPLPGVGDTEEDPREKFEQSVSQRLKQLDREVRQFRDKDASAARRLDEVEAQVLAARTRIARLEAKLATLKLLLDAARRDLAKLTPAARPQTAPGPTAAPAPAPVPKKPLAQILTQHRRDVGNDIVITGTVKNISERPLTFILIRATFYDRDGNVLDTREGHTNPRIIPPGTRATFRILGRYNRRMRRYTLSVRTE